MGRKRSAVKRHEEDWQLEEEEPPDQVYQDRTLVLRKEPLPRKKYLIAAGVKEIRCICCVRVKPLQSSEELGEGWICKDCLPDSTVEQRHAG
jgi:hypothetical protein